ncbi:MAG: hypothetical protein P8M73_11840 [Luminiphilus sp.]|jgi:hypothetical protein|nr:hypothetical protein [Luminiphilus sp.]
MNIVETEFWCLMVPPEWLVEQRDDIVCIVDQDHIGELAITTLVREESQQDPIEIDRLASAESPEIYQWVRATCGAFSGVTGHFEEEENAVKEWYLSYGAALLYVTYICDKEDAGMDEAAVDEILSTLVLGDAISDS